LTLCFNLPLPSSFRSEKLGKPKRKGGKGKKKDGEGKKERSRLFTLLPHFLNMWGKAGGGKGGGGKKEKTAAGLTPLCFNFISPILKGRERGKGMGREEKKKRRGGKG